MKLIAAMWVALACLPLAWADELFQLDSTPDFTPRTATPELLHQLREGGHVLYMRNGRTDISRPDRVPHIDLQDCTTQSPLSQDGKLEAVWIGWYMRKAGIPAGDIHSSPLCRARDTALATFGVQPQIESDLKFPAYMPRSAKQAVIEKTRELLSKPVEGRTNRIVVAHAANLMEVMGYLPKPEGAIVVFKPLGNRQFKYIATISPAQWKPLTYQLAR